MKRTILSVLVFIPAILSAQILNVPGDYATIQEGINAAMSGDTVLVQPGTYYENLFLDSKDIVLASTFIFSNDPQAIAQTIIDADNAGRGMVFWACGPGMEITGFTVQNGNASDGPGGGMEIHGSSLFVRNMVITNNYALQGGGLFCESSTLLLLDCNIIDNSADAQGGGIKMFNSNAYLDHCMIQFNSSESGTGLRYDINAPFTDIFNITIDSCLIAANTAIGQTGGVYIRRDGQNTLVEIDIRRTSFLQNESVGSGTALQIRGDSVNFDITGCKFMNNTAISYSAGISFLQRCSGHMENCLLADNTAALNGEYWSGGGITCWNSGEVFLNNCTFANNTAAYGAGLAVGAGAVAYAGNCIFWENGNQSISVEEFNGFGGILYIDYCDVQYGEDSVLIEPNCTLNWGDFNIDEDPLFEGTGDEMFSLSNVSPLIDAGPEDISGWDILPYDILGNVRVWDGDENGSAIIDMGAYEFGAPIYIGIPELPAKPLNGVVISNIFPNPASNILNIEYEMPDIDRLSCRIFNIQGQLLESSSTLGSTTGTLQASVGHLCPGIYLLILDSQNSYALRRFIVH